MTKVVHWPTLSYMSELGKHIIEGLEEALQYAKGNTVNQRVYKVALPENIDVKAIRQKLHMSQQEFSLTFGFSIHSVRNWEQGKRHPKGPAHVLLTVIAKEPEAVQNALSEYKVLV